MFRASYGVRLRAALIVRMELPIRFVETKMIQLTRLNGHALLVNADLIRHAEAIPDTTLTLVTGDKLVVLESCAEVLTLTLHWRAGLLREAWPSSETALVARAAGAAVNTHCEGR